jgi:hypothetical protein
MAGSLGVTADTVTNWERGHTAPRSDLRLVLLAYLDGVASTQSDEGSETGGRQRREQTG